MNREEVDAVAKDLGVTAKDVMEMEERLSARDASFDPPALDDESESFAPAGYLENQNAGPEEEIEVSQNEAVDQENLEQALTSLDARSREIIERRWLAENKATLHELADRFSVSAERIRQLEQSALQKMRAAITA